SREAVQGGEPVVSRHGDCGGRRRIRREREDADVRHSRLPGRVSARGATGDPEGPPFWRGGGMAAQATVGALSGSPRWFLEPPLSGNRVSVACGRPGK